MQLARQLQECTNTAARLVKSRRLRGDENTYQASTSGVMVGTAGKAAEGVCADGEAAKGRCRGQRGHKRWGAQTVHGSTHNQQFICIIYSGVDKRYVR